MDVAALSASHLADVQSQASFLVLRKALDLQQSSALQLLQALPQMTSSSNPTATVGRNIDTFA